MEDWGVGRVGGWKGKIAAARQVGVLRVVAEPEQFDEDLIPEAHLSDVMPVAANTVGSALVAGSPNRAAELSGLMALMDRVVERAAIRPRWVPAHVELDSVHQRVRVSRGALEVEESDRARSRPRGEDRFDEIEDLDDLIGPHAAGRGAVAGAVAVIGDGGSGKTWALARMAAEAAAAVRRQLRSGVALEEVTIPVWVPLTAVGEGMAKGAELADALTEAAVDHAYPEDPTGPGRAVILRMLARLVRSLHGVLVLADGLEEVTIGHDMVVKALGRLGDRTEEGARRGQQGCPLVVSSRPGAYPDLPGFARAELVALGADQQHAFVGAWFGSDPDLVAEVERRLAEPDLGGAASVPLLLALLCLVFDPANPNAVPTSRSSLLAAALDHLLTQPDRGSAGATTERRRGYKRRLLCHFAWAYAEAGWPLWLDERHLRKVLEDHPALTTDLGTPSTADLLAELEDRDGVLVHEGHGSYRWIHPLLGEYLAARHLADPKDDPDLDVDRVMETLRLHLHDPRWRNTVAMVVGCWANDTRNGGPERREGAAIQPIRFLTSLLGTAPDAFHHRRLHAGRALAEISETETTRLGLDRLQQRVLTELAVVACSPSRRDKINGIDVLANLGPRGLPALVLAADPFDIEFHSVITALGNLRHTDATAALARLAIHTDTRPEELKHILEILSQQAPEAALRVAVQLTNRRSPAGVPHDLVEDEIQPAEDLSVGSHTIDRTTGPDLLQHDLLPRLPRREAIALAHRLADDPTDGSQWTSLYLFKEHAPEEALRLARRLADEPTSSPWLLKHTLSLLTELAPSETCALAWRLINDPATAPEGLAALAERFPDDAVIAARRIAERLPHSDSLGAAVAVLAAQVPDEAFAIVLRLGENPTSEINRALLLFADRALNEAVELARRLAAHPTTVPWLVDWALTTLRKSPYDEALPLSRRLVYDPATPASLFMRALLVLSEWAPEENLDLARLLAAESPLRPDPLPWVLRVLSVGAPDEAIVLARNLAADSSADPSLRSDALQVLNKMAFAEALRFARPMCNDPSTATKLSRMAFAVLTEHASDEAVRVARHLVADLSIDPDSLTLPLEFLAERSPDEAIAVLIRMPVIDWYNYHRILGVLADAAAKETWDFAVARAASGDLYPYLVLSPTLGADLHGDEGFISGVGVVSEGFAAVGSNHPSRPEVAAIVVSWLQTSVNQFDRKYWRDELAWALSFWPGREFEAVEVVRATPESAVDWRRRGLLNARAGHHESAFECLESARRLCQDDAPALAGILCDITSLNLITWDGSQKMLSECDMLLNEANSLAQHHADLPRCRARVALLRGNVEPSVEWARRAVVASPGSCGAHLVLALCLHALASRDEVAAQRALHLDEGRQALDQALAACRDWWPLERAIDDFSRCAAIQDSVEASGAVVTLREAYRNLVDAWPSPDGTAP